MLPASKLYITIVYVLPYLALMHCTVITMAGIEYVKCPVMLFHGERDSTIPVGTALNLVQR